jgi:predicted TIM-barrel fold metal-dependent hydrolase
VDTHVHFFKPGKLKAGVSATDAAARRETPESFLRLAAPFGVVGMVIVEASDDIEDNQWVLDQAKANPGIVGYIGRLEPGTPGFARYLDRFSADPVFRGIRPHNQFDDLAACLANPAFHKDVSMLAERGLTFESGAPPAKVPLLVSFARRHPDLRIVYEHLPVIDWDGQDAAALRSALTESARLPNIYVKVSEIIRLGVPRIFPDPAACRQALDVIFSLFGPDRVMFGSNWPQPSGVTSYRVLYQLAADYVLPLGPEAAAKFFWRNSQAAYAWKARGLSDFS